MLDDGHMLISNILAALTYDAGQNVMGKRPPGLYLPNITLALARPPDRQG